MLFARICKTSLHTVHLYHLKAAEIHMYYRKDRHYQNNMYSVAHQFSDYLAWYMIKGGVNKANKGP